MAGANRSNEWMFCRDCTIQVASTWGRRLYILLRELCKLHKAVIARPTSGTSSRNSRESSRYFPEINVDVGFIYVSPGQRRYEEDDLGRFLLVLIVRSEKR